MIAWSSYSKIRMIDTKSNQKYETEYKLNSCKALNLSLFFISIIVNKFSSGDLVLISKVSQQRIFSSISTRGAQS